MSYNILIDIVTDVFILGWIIYSIAVLIYLNILSKRYLLALSKDSILPDTKLKDAESLKEQYSNTSEINILVLSGGGVRGVVPLHILSYLETITNRKIGELFDFFAGSSTGAISAAGFTVADESNADSYKFSAKEILDDYASNLKAIFSSPWYHQLLTLFGLFAPRFLPDGKMKVLEGYFGNLTLGELKGNLLVPVYNIATNDLQIVKNWSSLKGLSNDNYLVKDVINGASSPPMFFPPMAFSVGGKNHMFIDPAVLLNNPILNVFLYVRGLFPDKKLNLVLIGNGGTTSVKYNYKNMFSFGMYGLYQYLFSAPALSSKLYIEFIEEYLLGLQKADQAVNFFRVNSIPDKELSATDISSKNMSEIKKFANKMLSENSDIIDKISVTLLKSKGLYSEKIN
jgi:uncharacterized protein